MTPRFIDLALPSKNKEIYQNNSKKENTYLILEDLAVLLVHLGGGVADSEGRSEQGLIVAPVLSALPCAHSHHGDDS